MKKLCLILLMLNASSLMPLASASAPHILATSTDSAWQLSKTGGNGVLLTPLKQSYKLSGMPRATFTNPRYSLMGEDAIAWEVNNAAFSPSSKYALFQWMSGIPKDTNSEIDFITLKGYRRQVLPLSDLRNSIDMPTWSHNEHYLAASGGNLVRFWKLGEDISAQLLQRPVIKDVEINYAKKVMFSKDDKQLLVNYNLISNHRYIDKSKQLQAIYSVPDGKLLSTKVIPEPKAP